LLKEKEERQKKLEYIRIKEWEEKFDIEKKAKEQEEIRKEQRFKQKELGKIEKFKELENQSIDLNLELKDLDVNKSTKN
jgi:hypothetical protein